MTIFFLFRFLQFCNIRGSYCKYFQNNIYETDISSAAHRSTRILYKSNFCNKLLHLKKCQCVNIKNNCQFLVGHIYVSKFTFIKIGFYKKSKFFILLKVNLLSFFKCKYFFHILAYSCSEVIILFAFLLNILPPFFLIDLFKGDTFSFSSIFLYSYHYILLVTCDEENVSFRN